jgi:hypothetical protein
MKKSGLAGGLKKIFKSAGRKILFFSVALLCDVAAYFDRGNRAA